MSNEPTLPSDERVFADEVFGFELFWEKNKTAILIAAAAVVLAIVGGLAYWVSREAAKGAAATALAEAGDLDQLRSVAERFRGTAPAGVASILSAAALRADGDMAGSSEAFAAFAASAPESPLAPLARLGVAQNAAAAGKADEALAVYRELGAGSDPFTAPLARFLEARLLILSGQLTEARSLLQSISGEFPASVPARLVPGQLEQISLIEPAAGTN